MKLSACLSHQLTKAERSIIFHDMEACDENSIRSNDARDCDADSNIFYLFRSAALISFRPFVALGRNAQRKRGNDFA